MNKHQSILLDGLPCSVNAGQKQPRLQGETVRDKLLLYSTVDIKTGCWLWQRGSLTKGYGHLYVDGKTETTHRRSYETFIGPIPEKAHVLHRCDTPACINPKHLFLGSQADNMADMRAKGRSARGEKAKIAKLTEEEVLAIAYELEMTTVTHGKIAEQYGVTRESISQINVGGAWSFLTKASKSNPIRPRKIL